MKYQRKIKKSGDLPSSFGRNDGYGSICAVFQLIPRHHIYKVLARKAVAKGYQLQNTVEEKKSSN